MLESPIIILIRQKWFNDGANTVELHNRAIGIVAPRKCPLNMTEKTAAAFDEAKENLLNDIPSSKKVDRMVVAQINKEEATLQIVAMGQEYASVKCHGILPKGRQCKLMDKCQNTQDLGAVIYFSQRSRYK